MREKWIERFTGNSYWKGESTDPQYKNLLSSLDSSIDALLQQFTSQSSSLLFCDLPLVYPTDRNTTDSNHSAAFDTAMDRIKLFATAWASQGSKYYQSLSLQEDIVYALDWFCSRFYNASLSHDDMFGNWWHWWIGIPRSLASTLILMHSILTPQQRESYAATLLHFNEDPKYVYLNRGWNCTKKEMISGNLADTCLVSALRGVAFSDSQALENSIKYFSNIACTVFSGEGFYPDGSFIQHKNLAYTGGYGVSLLNGLERLLFATHQTQWEVCAEGKKPLYDWIWNGIRPLYAQGAMFDMVSGRGITRPDNNDYQIGKNILQLLTLLTEYAEPEMKSNLQQFIKSQLLCCISLFGEEKYYSNIDAVVMMKSKELLAEDSIPSKPNCNYAKMFGAMDKAVAHGTNFHFGVSMASTRTGRFEYGNYENKKGWHQSDGATYLYQGDPTQYSDNYWNTVDSHRLAGITTDHCSWDLTAWEKYNGYSHHVGGATLQQNAVFSMEFKNFPLCQNPNLYAKKSWFVFGGQILAMGTEITGIDSNLPAETIVENKKIKLDGSNTLFVDHQSFDCILDSVHRIQNAKSIWLEGNQTTDSTGYYFPIPTEIILQKEVRTGSWYQVNGTLGVSDQAIQCCYCSISLPHTNTSIPQEYQYIILPNTTKQELEQYCQNPPLKILSNTPQLQAAMDTKQSVTAFSFWQAGSYAFSSDSFGKITVLECDSPVMVILQIQKEAIRLSIAEPTQQINTVGITLYGHKLQTVHLDPAIRILSATSEKISMTVDIKNSYGTSFFASFL